MSILYWRAQSTSFGLLQINIVLGYKCSTPWDDNWKWYSLKRKARTSIAWSSTSLCPRLGRITHVISGQIYQRHNSGSAEIIKDKIWQLKRLLSLDKHIMAGARDLDNYYLMSTVHRAIRVDSTAITNRRTWMVFLCFVFYL